MQFEQLIETMFGLAADGKTNRKGMPNPLHLAVIAKHHFDDASSFRLHGCGGPGRARRPRRSAARLRGDIRAAQGEVALEATS